MSCAMRIKTVCILLALSLLRFNGFAEIMPSYRQLIAEKYRLNSDTVGWINVPGTNINDVVVQNPPSNNSYYLTHNFYGIPDKDGAFCVDRRCSLLRGGELSRNTTVYGHSWYENINGDLFHQLKRYANPNFAKDYPYIYLSTDSSDMTFEIFAIFYTTVNLPYNIPDLSWERFSEVMNVAYASSIYNYGMKITENDKILTLSTCTYYVPGLGQLEQNTPNDYRYVIMARLVDNTVYKKERAYFSLNENIMPVTSQPFITRDDPEYIRIMSKQNIPVD